MRIRVLSWNIWMGKYLPKIIDLLKREYPDIIALQEVVQNPDGTENTAERIAKALGYHWVFANVMRVPFGDTPLDWGEAVLSKYDIVSSVKHDLLTAHKRIALQADIRVGTATIHAVSTHIIHSHQQPSEEQQEQVDQLCGAVPKDHTVIMGDFNAVPESETIHIMKKSLVDADPANQPTWCVYPDGCKECKLGEVKHRLDYLFTTPDLSASDYRAISSDGSDHLPIIADITTKLSIDSRPRMY